MRTTEQTVRVYTKGTDVLATWMDFRDMTVRELAIRAKCSHGTIGELRAGRRRTTTAKRAHLIAKALQVPVDQLFAMRPSTVQREVIELRPGGRASVTVRAQAVA